MSEQLPDDFPEFPELPPQTPFWNAMDKIIDRFKISPRATKVFVGAAGTLDAGFALKQLLDQNYLGAGLEALITAGVGLFFYEMYDQREWVREEGRVDRKVLEDPYGNFLREVVIPLAGETIQEFHLQEAFKLGPKKTVLFKQLLAAHLLSFENAVQAFPGYTREDTREMLEDMGRVAHEPLWRFAYTVIPQVNEGLKELLLMDAPSYSRAAAEDPEESQGNWSSDQIESAAMEIARGYGYHFTARLIRLSAERILAKAEQVKHDGRRRERKLAGFIVEDLARGVIPESEKEAADRDRNIKIAISNVLHRQGTN